jgi:hypothetical protein
MCGTVELADPFGRELSWRCNMRNRLPAIAVLVGGAMMPGCVVWDIRDELRQTNARIDSIKIDLAKTNELLESVNTELATTNATMTNVQERLAVLEPIQDSLDSLDESMKTVKGIIENIPFVGESEGEKNAGAPE